MAKPVELLRQQAEERRKKHDNLLLEVKLQRALERGHEGTKEVKKLRKQLEERKTK